jgi:hypothetical protein
MSDDLDISPLLATAISFIIPGVGMIMAGRPVKGRGMYWLAATVILAGLLAGFTLITLGLGGILLFGWPLVHFAAGVDTYVQCDRARS